jgi:hypothetical protein
MLSSVTALLGKLQVSMMCPKSSAPAEDITLFCWMFTGFNGMKKFQSVMVLGPKSMS